MREEHALPVLADMTLGLEHLHACGIIHRDLKPENMLLTPTGRLKLADFGLSHVAVRTGRGAEDVAKDPSIVGTPFYMAPETIRGKARGFEAAADWWSFGVITYEFLLGFPPFQGAKVGEIYRSILSLNFAAPIGNCAVSPGAVDLVTRMLVPDPRRRLVGAAAVMAHPFFRSIEWQQHTQSTGAAGEMSARSSSASLSQSLHSLAAAGGSLQTRGAVGNSQGQPVELRNHSGGSTGVARSVTSLGIESDRSAASTTLAELATEHDGTQTSHLDNLMALNECSTMGCVDGLEER